MSALLSGLAAAVLLYLALRTVAGLVCLLTSLRGVARSTRERIYEGLEDAARNPLAPPVSVLLPAFSDAGSAAAAVAGLLRLEYPRVEVVVVHDGSTQGALPALKKAFDLVPEAPEEVGKLPMKRVHGVYRSRSHGNLVVIDKEDGGRADALNAALNHSQHPYFCPVEPGQAPAPDALLRLVRAVLESPSRVVAVGGAVRTVKSQGTEALRRFRAVEYLREVMGEGVALSGFNGLMTLSGTFPLVEREAVAAMGGYRGGDRGEDVDFVVRLHRSLRDGGQRDYAVSFVPEPVCWARADSGLAAMSRRTRAGQAGLLEMLGRNDAILFDSRYGGLGSVSYPYLLLFKGWGVVLEGAGYALFAARLASAGPSSDFVLAFLSLAVVGPAALSVAGLVLGEVAFRRDPSFPRLAAGLCFALLEGVCYRPLAVALRIIGTVDFLRRRGAARGPAKS